MTTPAQSEFSQVIAQFVARFRHDPVGYALAMHQMEMDDWQASLSRDIDRGIRQHTIKSGHGVGKTKELSLIVSWWANTRYPWRIVMTAPTSTQLWDGLWPEVCARFKELNPILSSQFDIKAERIELKEDPENCFITARGSRKDQPEAIQGIHSPNALILADEASGIPDEVFNAGMGSMSEKNACVILTGNPTRRSGFFYETHTSPSLRDDWNRITVSGLDSKFVDRDFVNSIIKRCGLDSNEYRIRVLGEFPKSELDVLIDRDLVTASFDRQIDRPDQKPVWGIDPARYGRDSTVFTPRWGNYVGAQEVWPKEDTMQLTGRIRSRFQSMSPARQPAEINIDVIGIGSGVCDRLREFEDMRGLINMVNVTEASPPMSRGYRLRDHLWLQALDWLEKKAGHIDASAELADELSTPTYRMHSDGRYQIESKDDMQKRGHRSPNRADSFNLTFAGDQAILAGNPRWGGSVRSKVRVV